MNTAHPTSQNGKVHAPAHGEQARRAQACPPHRWGCPVVMKLDPRSVAWTCAACGAIVTTTDTAAPPPAR